MQFEARQPPYLEHHGIKGQQWGICRFQNEDGSLTAEGKQRYNDDTEYLETTKGKKIATDPHGMYRYMKSSREASKYIREQGEMAKTSGKNMRDKESQKAMNEVVKQYNSLAKEVRKTKFKDIDFKKLKKAERYISDQEMKILTDYTRKHWDD